MEFYLFLLHKKPLASMNDCTTYRFYMSFSRLSHSEMMMVRLIYFNFVIQIYSHKTFQYIK